MTIKRSLRRVRIGVRLAVMTAVVISVSLGAFGAVSVIRQREQMVAGVQDEARRLIESLEGSLRGQMMSGDVSLDATVEGIVRPGDVESVSVARHDGRVRYSTDKALVGRTFPITDARCSGCHSGPVRRLQGRASVTIYPGRMVAEAVKPILNAPACYSAACHAHRPDEAVLGVMELDLPYASLVRAQRRHWLQMGLLALGIVIVTSLLVILLIRRWVGRPVAQLVAGTRQIAAGDLDHQFPRSEGELGELASAFNQMQVRLKETQRQIVMSEKLATVGRLAAGVAHEINNPLTGILTFAEDLHEESAPDDPARADYEVIRNEALRCREIVRGLLDFSRQQQPRLQPTRPSDAIQATLKLVQKLARFHDVTIEERLPSDLPRVMADAGQLQQVILNLLVNAAEAMPGGGTLIIRGTHDRPAGMVRLGFEDSGAGIPPAQLARIFEPFFSTKGGKTSGLGLAVSWSIVEQHGGTLEASSVVGQGTTFTLSLPASPPS